MNPVVGSTQGLLDLTVGEVAHGGWCVAREPGDTPHDGGRVVFVRHALPGERVLARVTDATARFARAEAVHILEASPDRVEPRCPHARPDGCGGCDWQHASLDAQRRLKAAVITQQLRRIAGLEREVTVEPLPGDDAGLHWRTRVRFAVRPDGTAGLRKHRSHEVVDVGDCPIAHPLVQQAGATGRHWEGARSVEVVASAGSADRALIVSPATSRRPARLSGQGFLRQMAAGRTWRVSAGAFWQVHPGAADALAGAVLDALRPQPGDVALDLYCGAGLFAGVLAEAVGPTGTVIGVEADPAAVRDARRNMRGTPWARVHRGDAAEVLGRGGWPQAGLAVLDPPRTGAARPVIERLLAPSAAESPDAQQAEDLRDTPSSGGLRRVAYVSCDPATLARDLAVFAESGWRLAALRAFDAFPMTHHVECVATLLPE